MHQHQHQMRNVLDTEKVGKLLFTLALPAFFGMFVQTLYNVTNTIFIGHIPDGANAIAGLSIVFPVQMFMMGVGMMVGMGGTSLISRFLGSREHDKAEKTLGTGLVAIVILSVVITALILPNVNRFMRLMGADDIILPYASRYLVIIVSGTTINLIGLALLNFIRAEGNARVPMIANILGAGLNIVFDWFFILVMRWNVTGAALGTVLAQTVALVYLAFFYLNGNSYLKVRRANLRLDTKILKPMFAVGVSSFAQTAAGSISAIFLINQVVRYGGDIYLSAFGVVQRVMMFATMPAMVIGQGAQPILGFNYGAKRYALAIKTFNIAALFSTIFSAVIFAVIYSTPGSIIKIFSSDPALVDAGIVASRMAFIGMPIMGLVMLGSNSFMSLGKAVQAFVTAIARPALFLLPAVLIWPRFLQIKGVFLAFPTSDWLTLVLSVLLLIPVFSEFRRAAQREKPLKLEPVRVETEPPDRDLKLD